MVDWFSHALRWKKNEGEKKRTDSRQVQSSDHSSAKARALLGFPSLSNDHHLNDPLEEVDTKLSRLAVLLRPGPVAVSTAI